MARPRPVMRRGAVSADADWRSVVNKNLSVSRQNKDTPLNSQSWARSPAEACSFVICGDCSFTLGDDTAETATHRGSHKYMARDEQSVFQDNT